MVFRDGRLRLRDSGIKPAAAESLAIAGVGGVSPTKDAALEAAAHVSCGWLELDAQPVSAGGPAVSGPESQQ